MMLYMMLYIAAIVAVCNHCVLQAGWSCSQNCHLGYFLYMSFNETDFNETGKLYNYNIHGPGFHKRNLTANAQPESATWSTSMVHLYHSKGIAKQNYVCYMQ